MSTKAANGGGEQLMEVVFVYNGEPVIYRLVPEPIEKLLKGSLAEREKGLLAWQDFMDRVVAELNSHGVDFGDDRNQLAILNAPQFMHDLLILQQVGSKTWH